MSFDDFITDTKNKYRKYQSDQTARAVYNFLSQQLSICLMLFSNDIANTSALQPLAKKIEGMCNGTSFDLDSKADKDADNRKQCIGAMVRHVIEPYGYIPTHKRKVSSAQHFVTAMHYSRTAPVTKQLEIAIRTKNAATGEIIASHTFELQDFD